MLSILPLIESNSALGSQPRLLSERVTNGMTATRASSENSRPDRCMWFLLTTATLVLNGSDQLSYLIIQLRWRHSHPIEGLYRGTQS